LRKERLLRVLVLSHWSAVAHLHGRNLISQNVGKWLCSRRLNEERE
jgi:hypothetical protein